MSVEGDLKVLIDRLVSDVLSQVSRRVSEQKNANTLTLCLLFGCFMALALYLHALDSKPENAQCVAKESQATQA